MIVQSVQSVEPITVVCRDDRNALIATLPAESFGSSNVAQLQSVARRLNGLAQKMSEASLIVDISPAFRYGAGLIGVLVGAEAELRRRGRKMIVCGDRHGLMKTARLNQVVPLYDHVDQALNALKG